MDNLSSDATKSRDNFSDSTKKERILKHLFEKKLMIQADVFEKFTDLKQPQKSLTKAMWSLEKDEIIVKASKKEQTEYFKKINLRLKKERKKGEVKPATPTGKRKNVLGVENPLFGDLMMISFHLSKYCMINSHNCTTICAGTERLLID